ncbi:MAG: hypothetical protein CVV64_07225 [Candidatus Wallbacteria bacterium HGW-Wallbacteria-1]|jgi:pSer/pThr/pTyr-binding forkhead associated (FHA) protein|uniref:FHA domain-containing protein n=1 Tax=Candidatus Wallbacteria bacterium HGW-Wallbacteria-1 TaxID=2013854 RepID=A0A2N1PT65_9BACT|nr:MAG: hypothetical protein CVV64_07225 [Candidatus Wallbacteria bacterium HGW-Wallbacteria-1]
MTGNSGDMIQNDATGARLVVMMGERQREFDFSKNPLTIGRTPENDVAVSFDKVASRRHAQVEFRDGEYLVSDLGSRNGTLLNGKKVEGEVHLNNGDVITIGDTDIRFEIGDSEEAYSGTMLIDQSEARKAMASIQPYTEESFVTGEDEPQWVTIGFWGAIALIVGLIVYAVLQL